MSVGFLAMMGDDLLASEAFEQHERRVVAGSNVVVRPPKRFRDLHRRRVRAATGNAEADRAGLRRGSSVTSGRTMLALAVEHPLLIPTVFVFLG